MITSGFKLHSVSVMAFCIIIFFTATAHAQLTSTRLEAYGGYSLLRPNLPKNIGGSDPSVEQLGQTLLGNVLGWNGGLTANITNSFGVTADLSGYYKKLDIDDEDVHANLKLHTFLFGPRFTRRGETVRPFAHALFGFGHASAKLREDSDSENLSRTLFAAAVGVGLDIAVRPNFAIRVIQFDYFPVRNSETKSLTFQNIRWGTGVVFYLR